MSNTLRTYGPWPTSLFCPWDSPGKNTGVGCHFLLQCMKVKSESEVAQSCQLFVTSWTAAHQASPSMGFSRQEYWSGLPLPSPTAVSFKSLFEPEGKQQTNRPIGFKYLKTDLLPKYKIFTFPQRPGSKLCLLLPPAVA